MTQAKTPLKFESPREDLNYHSHRHDPTVHPAIYQNPLGQVIKQCRKERRISQEDLAKNAGVDRTTIARFECGKFRSLSVVKLEGIATALGIDLKVLLLRSQSTGEAIIYRGHVDKIEFVLSYPEEGFKILSLIPRRREFFFGKIEIEPQRTILSTKLPHPEQIYLHCLDGKIILIRGSQEFLLKSGDCFAFSGLNDYELYNPDQLRKTSSLFNTYPSFLAV